MATLSPKDKEALAYFYETEQFQAFERFCALKRSQIAEQLLSKDMSEPGAAEKVAMLQGQAYTFEYLLLEIKSIHNKQQPQSEG